MIALTDTGAGSSQAKRVRSASPRELTVKRSRPDTASAHERREIEKRILLDAQMENAWSLSASMEKKIHNFTKTMRPEDLSSRLVTQS